MAWVVQCLIINICTQLITGGQRRNISRRPTTSEVRGWQRIKRVLLAVCKIWRGHNIDGLTSRRQRRTDMQMYACHCEVRTQFLSFLWQKSQEDSNMLISMTLVLPHDDLISFTSNDVIGQILCISPYYTLKKVASQAHHQYVIEQYCLVWSKPVDVKVIGGTVDHLNFKFWTVLCLMSPPGIV